MNIDPYKVLGVEISASPVEIKRAYKRLSLQHHPDKVQQKGGEVDVLIFPQIQFAYSVLSDAQRRQRYDTTGSLGHAGDEDADRFDWNDYFQNMTEKITLEMIDEDRIKYRGSTEERDDILHNFAYYEGDFLRLFEVVPHLEFDEAQEARTFQIIEEGIASGAVVLDKITAKTWEKYKKSRKTKVKQQLKKMAKEAQQADALAKKLGLKLATNENDLRAMIRRKTAKGLDTLISSLEAKYSGKSGRKRDVPDDEEFERIQEKLSRKKRRA